MQYKQHNLGGNDFLVEFVFLKMLESTTILAISMDKQCYPNNSSNLDAM